MAVGATRTQKAKVLQLTIDRFADQRAWRPCRLHVVVIPGFTAIESKAGRLCDQNFMAKSIPGWVSQHSQSPCLMNRLDNRCCPERFSHNRITVVVQPQSRVIQLETKGQHMNQATLQKSTDFHSAPESRH